MEKKNLFKRVFFVVDNAEYIIECKTTATDDDAMLCTFYNCNLFNDIVAFAVEHDMNLYKYSNTLTLYVPYSCVTSYGQFSEEGHELLRVSDVLQDVK